MEPLARTLRPKPTSTTAARCLVRCFSSARSFPTLRRPARSEGPHILQASIKSTFGNTPPTKDATRTSASTYQYFRVLVQKSLNEVLADLGPWHPTNAQHKVHGFNRSNDARQCVRSFSQAIERSFSLAAAGWTSRADNPLFWSLRRGFIRGNTAGLKREVGYAFRSFAGHSKFSEGVSKTVEEHADLRYPAEWYPATRALQRTIHLHVGPTNSGKTYHALKALEAAKTGIYAGPLRLLAHEIYSRFTSKGRPCALITGEERRIPENVDSYLASCTVEMTPLNSLVDVAVIDEIQMIADEERGWAWTQAVLGVQAKEVHLCGEERTVDIIQAICAKIGDKCVVHRYNRLSPLATMEKSINNNFKNLQKGDAVVSFSRVGIHALKAGIEKETGRRCAVVYGSLPPETRAQQAALFNDADNDYDFIVASDAIGMGLNLEIKRVVFDSLMKHDGVQHRFLNIPEIKQIGGRAGRYRTAAQDMKKVPQPAEASVAEDNAAETSAAETSVAEAEVPPASSEAVAPPEAPPRSGFVTSMETEDLPRIHEAFKTDATPIKAAGILPPSSIIEKYSSYFPPHTPLSHVLLKIREMSKISDEFFMCHFDTLIEIADIIHEFPMSVSDRCVLLTAPLHRNTAKAMEAMARCVSEMKGGHLLDIKEANLGILDTRREDYLLRPSDYLTRLEELHKVVTLYLWLSYRFFGVFTSQQLAFHVKELVEEKIQDHLEHVDFRPEMRQKAVDLARMRATRAQAAKDAVLSGDGGLPEEAPSSSSSSSSLSTPSQGVGQVAEGRQQGSSFEGIAVDPGILLGHGAVEEVASAQS